MPRSSLPMRACLLLSIALFGCATDIVSSESTIVDGVPATEAQIHGTVALVRWVDGQWTPSCTGTLIAPNIVLTAAHCVIDTDWSNLDDRTPTDIRELAVAAGTLDLAAIRDDQLYGLCSSRTVLSYPNPDVYENPSSLGRADDLAVVVLLEDVTQVTPVPILPYERVDEILAPGSTVVLTGYGRTDVTEPAGVLHWAETPVVERSVYEVLVGGIGEPDSCFGDSGGPGYVEVDGTIYLWGVTSRGNRAGAELCGEGGIYTLAPAYEDWIADNSRPTVPVSCAAAPGRSRTNSAPWRDVAWCVSLGLVIALSRSRRRRHV